MHCLFIYYCYVLEEYETPFTSRVSSQTQSGFVVWAFLSRATASLDDSAV